MYNRILMNNINHTLKDKGIRKYELSDISGVSPSYISDITNDNGNPSLDTMEAIAKALNTTLPELLSEHYNPANTIPKGTVKVTARVSKYQAFQIKKWEEKHNEHNKI